MLFRSKKPQTFRCFRFSFSLTLLRQILSGGDLRHFYSGDLRRFYDGVGATSFSLNSCRHRCSLLHSCRLRKLRLRRQQVRNNESIATRRAESTWTETESSRLGRRTSTLGTWMSLPTLSSLTMVLRVAPWLFTMKFWKTTSLIFGFTVKFFLGVLLLFYQIASLTTPER